MSMMNNELESPMNSSKLQELAKAIIEEAKRAGASQSEVGISTQKGFTVSAREGSVETVEYHQDKVVEIQVYFGKRTGAASTSDLRPEAVRAAVEAACHIAKFTDEDPAAGLAEKDELAFDYPQLDLAAAWPITVDQAIEIACECEREALAYDKRVMSAEEATVTTGTMLQVYANSHGFLGWFPDTRHEISCVVIAKEKDEMQRDFSYSASSDPSQLHSTTFIAREAAEKAVRRLGSQSLPTMKAPVIFAAEEARGLFGHFASAISGSHLYRKSSFLLDHLDKKIFPDFIHIQEHPHLAHALGSAPFDEDGVATRANIFVDDGVLRSYSLGVYSARKLGMKTTGNAGGVHNLTVKTGEKDLRALLKTMDKGLLITELMGHGVNLVTGNYSRGVGGFWVEHGEIQYPVHEITVAGTLQEMFACIVDVGNDIDRRGTIRTGSVLIEEMMIAGR